MRVGRTRGHREEQSRWPRGTPVAPSGRGPGGGRFRDEGPDWATRVAGLVVGADGLPSGARRLGYVGMTRDEMRRFLPPEPQWEQLPMTTTVEEAHRLFVQNAGKVWQMHTATPQHPNGDWVDIGSFYQGDRRRHEELGRDGEPDFFMTDQDQVLWFSLAPHRIAPAMRMATSPMEGFIIDRLASQGAMAETSVVTRPDGSQVIQKKSHYEPKQDADTEYLASLVGQAIGAAVPEVITFPDHTVWMGFVEGGTMADRSRHVGDLGWDAQPNWRIALLDLLIGNQDRHNQNWMVLDDGRFVGIDHNSAWYSMGNTYPMQAGKPPAWLWNRHHHEVLVDPEDVNRYQSDWMGDEELARVQQALELLRPEFEARGRIEWYEYTMDLWRDWRRAQEGIGDGS